MFAIFCIAVQSVSYTHLDVYKRQAGNSPFSNIFGKLQGKHMDKVLKNCASHSRYFSDELGALFFENK